MEWNEKIPVTMTPELAEWLGDNCSKTTVEVLSEPFSDTCGFYTIDNLCDYECWQF
jgi:hypothetical protein